MPENLLLSYFSPCFQAFDIQRKYGEIYEEMVFDELEYEK